MIKNEGKCLKFSNGGKNALYLVLSLKNTDISSAQLEKMPTYLVLSSKKKPTYLVHRTPKSNIYNVIVFQDRQCLFTRLGTVKDTCFLHRVKTKNTFPNMFRHRA